MVTNWNKKLKVGEKKSEVSFKLIKLLTSLYLNYSF